MREQLGMTTIVMYIGALGLGCGWAHPGKCCCRALPDAMAKHGLTPAGRGDRMWATLSQEFKGWEWARVVERLASSVA